MEEPRHIQVVDFTYGKRDSEGVDTSISFTSNFKECKSIQQANVVIAAYVNANYVDNFKIKEDLDKAINDITSINSEISNINIEISDHEERIINNETEISTINNNITNINTSLTNIETLLNTHSEDIESINTNINNINTSLININNEIDNIKVKSNIIIAYLKPGTDNIFDIYIDNELENNMILNISFGYSESNELAKLTIKSTNQQYIAVKGGNYLKANEVSEKYLTLINANGIWLTDNLASRVKKIETNGVIGATQYGGTLIEVIGSLDTINKSGFYTCYTGTPGLSTEMNDLAVSFHILHQNSNVGTGGAYQRAVAFTTGESKVFERTKVANIWSSWVLAPKRSEITNLNSGWLTANETWTFVSVDDPSGTFKVNADVTTKYSLGMRYKFLNGGNTIYGICTKISAYNEIQTGYTHITFLHEIDPTDSLALHLMANSAITDKYYSNMKVPFGFPIITENWTVYKKDTADRIQASPTVNVWYNLNNIKLRVPIGAFDISHESFLVATGTANNTTITGYSTLSTANNSQSDASMTYPMYILTNNTGYSGAISANAYKEKKGRKFDVATDLYLNVRGTVPLTSIETFGSYVTTQIKAVCTYL